MTSTKKTGTVLAPALAAAIKQVRAIAHHMPQGKEVILDEGTADPNRHPSLMAAVSGTVKRWTCQPPRQGAMAKEGWGHRAWIPGGRAGVLDGQAAPRNLPLAGRRPGGGCTDAAGAPLALSHPPALPRTYAPCWT